MSKPNLKRIYFSVVWRDENLEEHEKLFDSAVQADRFFYHMEAEKCRNGKINNLALIANFGWSGDAVTLLAA